MSARIVLYPSDVHDVPGPRRYAAQCDTLGGAESWCDNQDGGSYLIGFGEGRSYRIYRVPDDAADRYTEQTMGLGAHVERRIAR